MRLNCFFGMNAIAKQYRILIFLKCETNFAKPMNSQLRIGVPAWGAPCGGGWSSLGSCRHPER